MVETFSTMTVNCRCQEGLGMLSVLKKQNQKGVTASELNSDVFVKQ